MSENRLRATRFVTALDHFLNARDAIRGGGIVEPSAIAAYIQATEFLIQTTIALDMAHPPFAPGAWIEPHNEESARE